MTQRFEAASFYSLPDAAVPTRSSRAFCCAKRRACPESLKFFDPPFLYACFVGDPVRAFANLLFQSSRLSAACLASVCYLSLPVS